MDAASIEQMNKVRVSLGMAPLPVPGATGPQFKQSGRDDSDSDESDDLSTIDKRQAAAGGNWQKLEDERLAQLERQKRKDAAKKARDIAQKYSKLEGKGLGDADEKEVDTKTWLREQKKRQAKIEKARKLAEELAAREQQAEYTAKDLAGVKVGHEVDEFEEGGEQILTLKDAAIGEESEDDELENQDMRAREKLQEKLELQKKKPVYNPNDADEKKGILAQYDEEIDGKQHKRFTLDGQGNTVEAKRIVSDDGEVGKKRVKINLDMLKDDTPANDYMDLSMVKVKKPKKKKSKTTRQKAADEDDIFPITEPPPALKASVDSMEFDGAQPAVASKKRALEFDDEDLQAGLAQQRRQALKKRKKTDAAEVARQMREEASVTPMETNEDEDEDGPGMIIDETSEFVANLQRPSAPEIRESKTIRADSPDEDGDTAMAQESYAGIEDEEERAARAAREASTPAANIGATGLEEEDSMSGGMANTLKLLRGRGLVDKLGNDQNEIDRKRAKFLYDKKDLIEQYDANARADRERDRRNGRMDNMSARDRDAYARSQNEAREKYLAQLQAEMFNRDYRPNVNLKYTDEHGRNLSAKEAFKELSHQFHGKGSGKQKTDKHLKKIYDEKRREAKGVLDASNEGGMSGALASTGRKQKQAGVRLQ